ncbi:hypothetical protein RFF05_17475 [Bengtsoniella intestinalis]|uniref:hypothetical protein n=1 Tax=Bengtsoniella intestinalis TaxID=3073143 RepID=UPI00391F4E29
MKQSFLSFASRYVMAILLGLGLLLLHTEVEGGALTVFIPQTISPWELGKIAFWPLLLVAVVLPSPQSLAPCVVTTVGLVLLGWLCQGIGLESAVILVLWMALLALSLYCLQPKESSPWWVVAVLVLGVGFVMLTFFPALWGPFLDPTDVAAMATLAF